MRIITAVISVIMAAVLYDFSNKASLVGVFSDSEELSGIAGAALIGALLWVVGGAIVYFYPRAAMVVYLLSFAVMGLTQLGAAVETDFAVYLWFGPIFALMSFFGWRQKRNSEEAQSASTNQMTIQQSQMNYFLSQQRTAAQEKALNERVAQFQKDTGIGTGQQNAVKTYGAQYRQQAVAPNDPEQERLDKLAQFRGNSGVEEQKKQTSKVNFCPNCGSEITTPGRFCPNCGIQIA